MQESDNNNVAKTNHRKVKNSTTLNRKYTKRPVADSGQVIQVKRSSSISHFGTQPMNDAEVTTCSSEIVTEMPAQHPIQEAANNRMRQQSEMAQQVQQPSAKEIKDQAIKQALVSASTSETTNSKSHKARVKDSDNRLHFGFGRVALALACATVAVFAIVYFVNLNMPDISMRVAAMQTGMDPSYPGYIPRGYNVSSITSESNKITMEFVSSSTDGKFILTEEKSSWDSNALASNYVKKTYGEDYTTIKEQGLTIFISGSNAVWVNGGNMFKIDTVSGTLTNKQIRSIATSL